MAWKFLRDCQIIALWVVTFISIIIGAFLVLIIEEKFVATGGGLFLIYSSTYKRIPGGKNGRQIG